MSENNEDSEGPSNFLAGISSFLVMALFIPGAVSTFFALWLIRGESIAEFFTGDKCTLTGGIAASLFLGLILTPFAFICESPLKFIRTLIRKVLCYAPPDHDYFALTKDVIKWESKGLIGWYFFQVWGQFIMHWNIALSLIPIAGVYLLRGFHSCHRSVENQPSGVDSKPATLRHRFHNSFIFCFKGIFAAS